MMLGCPLFFYSSMKSLHPLLHRLRLKRRLINTGNKFLLANFPNKVTGRPSSLLYDHLVLCMSISSLHPSLSNSLFPQPMLTALPVTHLVDSGSISFIVYIYWSINHLVGMLQELYIHLKGSSADPGIHSWSNILVSDTWGWNNAQLKVYSLNEKIEVSHWLRGEMNRPMAASLAITPQSFGFKSYWLKV